LRTRLKRRKEASCITPGSGRQDKMKMDLRETGLAVVNFILIVEKRDK
jgi:hypothetical protein